MKFSHLGPFVACYLSDGLVSTGQGTASPSAVLHPLCHMAILPLPVDDNLIQMPMDNMIKTNNRTPTGSKYSRKIPCLLPECSPFGQLDVEDLHRVHRLDGRGRAVRGSCQHAHLCSTGSSGSRANHTSRVS